MSSSPGDSAGPIELHAPAKINLYLRIIAKRADGYHELDSLMLKLEFGDRLVLARRRAPGIELHCRGADLPVDRENLVCRAATAFCDHCGIEPALTITLVKKIPVAAGLGGGSSDAAAVLRGLDRLYNTGLDDEALTRLARPLGADVPFFVQDAVAARAQGIGELLTPVSLPPGLGSIVLVNPGFAVSTAWVYGNFRLTKQSDPYIFSGSLPEGKLVFGNDLEQVTMVRHPELIAIRDELLAAGAATAMMAGSGPTMFALFKDREEARICAARMGKKYKQVFLTKPLDE